MTQVRVVVARGTVARTVALPTGAVWTVGSDPSADVVLDDPALGAAALVLRAAVGGVEVEITGSSRALLNDVQLRGRSLARSGDVIQLGDWSLLLVVGHPRPEEPPSFAQLEPVLRREVEASRAGALALVEVRRDRPKDRERLERVRAEALSGAFSGRSWFAWLEGAEAAARLKELGRGSRLAIAARGEEGDGYHALLAALLRRWLSVEHALEERVLADPVMLRLRALAERFDPASLRLGIEGEPGVGRATFARELLESKRVHRDADRVDAADQRQRVTRLEAPFAVTFERRELLVPELAAQLDSTLFIPPLRDRPADVAAYAGALLSAASPRARLTLSPGARLLLEAYGWPGNFDELTHVVLRAAELAFDSGHEVLPRHLPDRLQALGRPSNGEDLRTSLRTAEKDAMLAALAQTGWNVSEASRVLRLPRRTVVYRMRRLGLKRPGR